MLHAHTAVGRDLPQTLRLEAVIALAVDDAVAGAVQQVAAVNAHGVLIADALTGEVRNTALGQKGAGHRVKGVDARGHVNTCADLQRAQFFAPLIHADGLRVLVNQQAIAVIGGNGF